MPGWQSGQLHQTVNLTPLRLRRFESFTRHHTSLLWSFAWRSHQIKKCAPHSFSDVGQNSMYYVYIVRLKSGKFYTGFTSNLRARINRHRRKNPTKTTAIDPIDKLLFYCAFSEKTGALSFETYLKSSSGKAFRNKSFCPRSSVVPRH